jgi:60 kDa SS-A/Ro ribonucleoprotein
MLTALDLSTAEWVDIAKTAKWHMTRMNLNTFERHGVFKVPGMTQVVANRLKDAESIKHSSVFPYQLFAAYKHADPSLPLPVTNALQDAMEVATENVPALPGKVLVAVDCSGSMSCPVTGARGSATSKIECNEVASLIAACVVRKSNDVKVMKFDTNATVISLNPRDSVMTNLTKIGFHGGGTDCGAPLRKMNASKENADIVIIVSDNESWCNDHYGRGTSLQNEWQTFKRHNPKAKMICIDLAANATTQVKSGGDTLNIGGFSDTVFQVISGFLESGGSAEHWTNKIKSEIKL